MQIYQEKIFDLLNTQSKMMQQKIQKARNVSIWQSTDEEQVIQD